MEWKRLGLAVMAAGIVGVCGAGGVNGGSSIIQTQNIPQFDGSPRLLGIANAKLKIYENVIGKFSIFWDDITVINDSNGMKAYRNGKEVWGFNDNCPRPTGVTPIFIQNNYLLAYCTDSTILKYTYVLKASGRVYSIRGRPVFRDDTHVYYISALSDNPIILRRFSTDTSLEEEFLRYREVILPDKCVERSQGPRILKFFKLFESILVFRADSEVCNFQAEVSLTGKLTYSGARR